MSAASWKSDPTSRHELRYWDGAAWTEHVADSGTAAVDQLPADAPPPPPPPPVVSAPPPPASSAASAGTGGGGFMNKLKGMATQAAEQGKSMVDQAKSSTGSASDQRTQQYANDPNTLWMGNSHHVSGLSAAFYRITKDRVWIESGLFGSKSESVPLWAVKDVDVRQAMWQKGKDIGDVVLILEDAAYGTSGVGMFDFSAMSKGTSPGAGTGTVVLDNIDGPYKVRDLLAPLVSEARREKLMERQSQYIHYATPVAATPVIPATAPVAPAAAAPVSVADELRKLGELRDAGVLTDEEFAAQKAKLLNS